MDPAAAAEMPKTEGIPVVARMPAKVGMPAIAGTSAIAGKPADFPMISFGLLSLFLHGQPLHTPKCTKTESMSILRIKTAINHTY